MRWLSTAYSRNLTLNLSVRPRRLAGMRDWTCSIAASSGPPTMQESGPSHAGPLLLLGQLDGSQSLTIWTQNTASTSSFMDRLLYRSEQGSALSSRCLTFIDTVLAVGLAGPLNEGSLPAREGILGGRLGFNWQTGARWLGLEAQGQLDKSGRL